ncbi:hypothetical protein ACFOYU_12835 [Microvirga sp. GCM10011540]|uniref:hypothetical protein n=1 Tax=Microvirga sp. GCM10011540 TaxID=3317338 RepID=UPI00361866CE
MAATVALGQQEIKPLESLDKSVTDDSPPLRVFSSFSSNAQVVDAETVDAVARSLAAASQGPKHREKRRQHKPVYGVQM